MSGLKGNFSPLAKLYEDVMFNVNEYDEQLLNAKRKFEGSSHIEDDLNLC